MSEAIERLGAAIEEALDSAPMADVLSVVTGTFVALVVELCRSAGEDPEKQITIEGPDTQRGITIHAKGKP